MNTPAPPPFRDTIGHALPAPGASRRRTHRRLLVAGLLALMVALEQPSHAGGVDLTKFGRIPTQYIAALADPGATAGNQAESWGLWPVDPGPRGVRLDRYAQLKSTGGVAPARWTLDGADWWLEEHGLIMEKPAFPVPPGEYLVTGDRKVTTVLTVHPKDKDGHQRWELGDGATLYDVTHLACRSARYTPEKGADSCTPANARAAAFPVTPGAAMPPVAGCHKQDYAVLIVIGMAVHR